MENLKNHFDSLFSFTSQVSYIEGHPLPIIQASKSLIGLDLDNPPKNMLKWLEGYLQAFEPNYQISKLGNDDGAPDILSTSHMKELIASDTLEESRKYLHHLLQTADSKHVMELLLEISFDYSSATTLFCWSAYKSILFMDQRESLVIMSIALDCLFLNNERQPNENDGYHDFQLYCHLHQMESSEFVRKAKIKPLLSKRLDILKDTRVPAICMNNSLKEEIEKKGKVGLLTYLSKLKIDTISYNLILFLDAMRSAMLFSQEADDIFKWKKTVDIC